MHEIWSGLATDRHEVLNGILYGAIAKPGDLFHHLTSNRWILH
jgi:hypothetical protein